MILLDTAYFIGLFEPDDELHARCVAWSHALRERAIVTEYVLWEGVNHLSSPPDRSKAHTLVEHIFAKPGYEFIRAKAGPSPTASRSS